MLPCGIIFSLISYHDREEVFSGLITWLQATFGCRLPIVQGGTISFLVPTLAILGLPTWKCPEQSILTAMTPEQRREVWTTRMCELSGAIAVSALFQLFGGKLKTFEIIIVILSNEFKNEDHNLTTCFLFDYYAILKSDFRF